MTYTDFRRLRLAALDCSSAQQLIDEDGGSVDCAGLDSIIADFNAIYNCRTVRDIRSLTGLSQAAFARAYGIPRRTVEEWERGSRSAPSYVMEMLLFAALSDREAERG